MFKMLFNTGVRYSPDIPLVGPFQHWIGGVKQIEFFLAEVPPKGAQLLYLCDKPAPGDNAIKVVAGGMLSEWAVFSGGSK